VSEAAEYIANLVVVAVLHQPLTRKLFANKARAVESEVEAVAVQVGDVMEAVAEVVSVVDEMRSSCRASRRTCTRSIIQPGVQ
jgi:hypothetical protein